MFTFTKNITAYSYSELSEQAKENVKENLYYDTINELMQFEYNDLWESTCTEYLNAQERWFTSEEFIEEHFNSNDYYFDSKGNYINVPAEVLKNL